MREGIHPLYAAAEGADGDLEPLQDEQARRRAAIRTAIQKILEVLEGRGALDDLPAPTDKRAASLFAQIGKRRGRGEKSTMRYLDRPSAHAGTCLEEQPLVMAALRYEYSFWEELSPEKRQVLFLYLAAHASYPSELGSGARNFLLQEPIDRFLPLADHTKTPHAALVSPAFLFIAILKNETDPKAAEGLLSRADIAITMDGGKEVAILKLDDVFEPCEEALTKMKMDFERYSGELEGFHPDGTPRIFLSVRRYLKEYFEDSALFFNHLFFIAPTFKAAYLDWKRKRKETAEALADQAITNFCEAISGASVYQTPPAGGHGHPNQWNILLVQGYIGPCSLALLEKRALTFLSLPASEAKKTELRAAWGTHRHRLADLVQKEHCKASLASPQEEAAKEKREERVQEGSRGDKIYREEILRRVEGEGDYLLRLFAERTGLPLADIEVEGEAGDGGSIATIDLVPLPIFLARLKTLLTTTFHIPGLRVEMGEDFQEMVRRYAMLDFTVPHEIAHRVLEAKAVKAKKEDYVRRATEWVERIEESENLGDRRKIVQQMMLESAMDGIGYQMAASFGTTDPRLRKTEDRIQKFIESFLVTLDTLLDITKREGQDEERRVSVSALLLRMMGNIDRLFEENRVESGQRGALGKKREELNTGYAELQAPLPEDKRFSENTKQEIIRATCFFFGDRSGVFS